jgi:hypothetical protein
MTTDIDFTKYIRIVLNEKPENWSLSRNFFHSFYKKNILKDNDGWSPEKVKIVLESVQSTKRGADKYFTESLLEQFLTDPEATNIINKMMEIVKICDVNAYKQDNSMPVVARTFVRQNQFYEKILTWKLEQRKENMRDDILECDIITPNMKNAFLCLYEPKDYIFMVSPKHREQFISTFVKDDSKIESGYNSTEGLIESNRLILNYFRSQLQNDLELLEQLESADLNEHFLSRVVSIAVYHPEVRPMWDIKIMPPAISQTQYWLYAPGASAKCKRQLNPSVCPSHFRPGDFRLSAFSLSCLWQWNRD